jgi:hypothetical protein
MRRRFGHYNPSRKLVAGGPRGTTAEAGATTACCEMRPENPWEAGPGMAHNLAASAAAIIKSAQKWTVKSAPLEFYSILPNFQPPPRPPSSPLHNYSVSEIRN